MNKFKPLSLDAEFENVMGYVHITYGPEREEFDSTKCQSTSDCTIVYHKLFTYNQYEHSYVVDVHVLYHPHLICVNI